MTTNIDVVNAIRQASIMQRYGLPAPGQGTQYVEVFYHSTYILNPSTTIPSQIPFFTNTNLMGTPYQNFVTSPTSVQVNTTLLQCRLTHNLAFTLTSPTTSIMYQQVFEEFTTLSWVQNRKEYGFYPVFDLIKQNVYNTAASYVENEKQTDWFTFADPLALIPGANAVVQLNNGTNFVTSATAVQALPNVPAGVITTGNVAFFIHLYMRGVELIPVS
jgi:hypothetical protein